MRVSLQVPARPQAVHIVRLVAMSCGAVAGDTIDEIHRRCRELSQEFMQVLGDPSVDRVVIRTYGADRGVDLVPLRSGNSGATRD